MQLLEKLTQTAGVPGREDRVRQVIQDHAKRRKLFDEMRVDAMGSLHGVRNSRTASRPARGRSSGGKKPLKVMVAAHMDQIGFLVRHVDDKGFLRVQNVGGFDTRNLFARLVTVCAEKGDLPGVLNPGGRPVHIASQEDRKKVPEIKELIVDLGLPADDVKKKVRIGDMVVIRAEFAKVGRTVVGQCMDNRVACWIALRAIEKLKTHDCEIHCVFTVQEEVGLRGAGPAAYAVEPDVAINLDTTLAVDVPGVPDEERVSRQGEGAGLHLMDSMGISDIVLVEELEALAKKKKIKAQRTLLPLGGTDAATIQRARAGCRVTTIVCPTRYIHTITEMVHTDDLHACRDLLAAYLAQA